MLVKLASIATLLVGTPALSPGVMDVQAQFVPFHGFSEAPAMIAEYTPPVEGGPATSDSGGTRFKAVPLLEAA